MRPPAGASLAILDALRDGPLCVNAVVRETGLSQSNVSNHLGRLRSLGWVTGERHGREVLYRITDYFVEQFVRSQERPGTPLGVRARRRVAGEALPRLVAALTAGREAEARDLTHEALLRGLDWRDLYLLLFTPALHEVGSQWQRGAVGVCEEHEATAIVQRLMARVFPGGIPRAGAPLAVVAAVEGNLHDVGARMVADFLVGSGWRVHYLGANIPTAELVRVSADTNLVALSVSQKEQLPALREAAAALRGLNPPPNSASNGRAPPAPGSPSQTRPLILAGGAAVLCERPTSLGVDYVDRYLPRTLRMLERHQKASRTDEA
jgi:methanogenic corrinoid protein MtbC1